MAIIEAYKPGLHELVSTGTTGGFDPASKTFTPFKGYTDVHKVLDAMAAAVEAGTIDTDKWVSQIFASTADFEEFLDGYSAYDECYRTYDRWYLALFRIANRGDEEQFVTSQEIADKLREVAYESGQLESIA